MAFILKDVTVTLNGTDITSSCSHVTVTDQRDSIDVSAPLVSELHETAPGPRTSSITLSLYNNYTAGSTDETLWGLYAAGSAFPIIITPTSGAASYNMDGWLPAYTPIDGGPGAAATTDVTVACADAAGITRGTA